MNRNFPLPPYGPRPARPPARPQSQESPYAPAKVLVGLINQSQNRYVTYRDLALKQDQGFGQLQIDAQNLAIALSRHDPAAYAAIQNYLQGALSAAEWGKRMLEQAMQYEIALQGELKLWLAGQPPSDVARGGAQSPQLPWNQQVVPPEWAQPSQQQQGAPLPQQPQSQQQPQQAPVPQYFKGQHQQQFAPGDMRDPAQAQAFLRRAQEMPLGPVPGQIPQPGQPTYQTPNMPSGQAPAVSGAPVTMQYADPSQQPQAQQPVQFQSAEAAQAAIAASHAANVPIAPPAPQNGATQKSKTT
jgi:hypothetical protein